jgi:hypothetical protein
MSLNYADTPTATARLQAVITALGGTAVLVIGTSALAGGAGGTLATFPLDAVPAVAALRVLTISGLPKNVNATASGVAAKAELRTGAGVVIANGLTVGSSGSGANVIVDTTTITNTRAIYLLSATITHP